MSSIHKGNAYADTAKYEILYDLPEGEYSDAGVGGIRTRTIRAGESLEVECYPLVHVTQEAVRERKRRETSPAKFALNRRNSARRMYRLLEANFGPGDLVLTPTFNYGFVDRGESNIDSVRREMEREGLPMDDDDARRIFRNFIARVRRLVKRRGGDPKKFKYLYVIETTHEPRDEDFNALPSRYHFHAVISTLGVLSADDVMAQWPYGYSNPKPLDMRHNGLAPLANYMTKLRKRGKTRRWAHSKNLREPTVRVSDRKVSRRRASIVARDVQYAGREIFERLYPGYGLEDCEVRYSDFVPGAYIYARLRRRR